MKYYHLMELEMVRRSFADLDPALISRGNFDHSFEHIADSKNNHNMNLSTLLIEHTFCEPYF